MSEEMLFFDLDMNYNKPYTVDSKTVYGWFYLEPITTRTVSLYYRDMELSDDELNITITDLKVVLRLMRSGKYDFKQIRVWTYFFFDWLDKLTYSKRHQKMNFRFASWQTGFSDDEIDYVIFSLWETVEDLLNENAEAEASMLFPYIDDLLRDIKHFEQEEELGCTIRTDLSDGRFLNCLVYFAELDGDLECLDFEERKVYNKVAEEVLEYQQGKNEPSVLLKKFLPRCYVENNQGDNGCKYVIRMKEEDGDE